MRVQKKAPTKGGKIFGGIVMFILAALFLVVVFFVSIDDLKYVFGKEPIDIYEALEDGTLDDNEGDYVTVPVDGVVDWYADLKHTVNYIPVGTDHFCVVWLDDESFISLSVKSKGDQDTIDDVIDSTWAYINGETNELEEPEEFVGKIEDIDSEVYEFYNEAMGIMGTTDGRDWNINATNSKGTLILWGVIYIVIAGFFIFGGISSIKSAKKMGANNQYMSANMGNGMTQNTMNDPYATNTTDSQNTNNTNMFQ